MILPSLVFASLRSMSTLLLSMLCTVALHAQNDSPCNQGRAVPPLEDPRHPYLICLPEFGRMGSTQLPCRYGAEAFGSQIVALGDVNGDSLMDWTVTHARCDTISRNERIPNEVLLYTGLRGALPDARDGQRIGPMEIESETQILASGDWDHDGHIDLAARLQLYGDTSDHNLDGYDIASLVVFWGNPTGLYALSDTTRLRCDANYWLGPGLGAGSTDWNGDGIDDLLVLGPDAGFSNGGLVPMPEVLLFHGHQRERWGRNNISASADWRWWSAPVANGLVVEDQDGDGAHDLVFIRSIKAGTGSIAVLYGRPEGGLPDTTDLQSIDLLLANGHSAQFLDVTGDSIPELLVHAGSQEVVKAFVGLRGQRLIEQYGSGNDDPQPGEQRWWGRPWARISLPKKINTHWPQSDWLGVFDLGDIDLDGVEDIAIYADPYVIFYRGGEYMDNLADAIVDIRPAGNWRSLRYLGDIDGSGLGTSAIGTTGGVIYAKPSQQVPQTGTLRRLPEGSRPASVAVHEPERNKMELAVRALPNPSEEDVQIIWDVSVDAGTVEVAVTDMVGRRIWHRRIPASDKSIIWHSSDAPPGGYIITVSAGGRSGTVQVILE